jgi:hypothetical protein
MMTRIDYFIEYYKELDTPMFRVCYTSKYYTGSHPIASHKEALDWIEKEFGAEQNITYAVHNIKVAVSEMVKDACKEMVNSKAWK